MHPKKNPLCRQLLKELVRDCVPHSMGVGTEGASFPQMIDFEKCYGTGRRKEKNAIEDVGALPL